METDLGDQDQTVHRGTGLPLEWEEGPQITGGIALLLLGTAFVTLPLLFAVGALTDSEIEGGVGAATGVLIVFALVGLGMAAWGIGTLRRRLEVTIDENEVQVWRRGLLGTRTWQQPLTAYSGVLPTERHRSGGENRSSYTEYRIVLQHGTEERYHVELYESHSAEGHQAETEAFARLLQLPVLMETPTGAFVERDAEDLDKSVADLVAEGKIAVPARPANLPPGNRLQVQRDGETIVFEAGYRWATLVGLILFAAGVGLLIWYFGPGLPVEAETPLMAPVMGGLFALIGGFVALFGVYGRERLRVTPVEVQLSSTLFQWLLSDYGLEAKDIEEVALKKDERGKFQITISSDEDDICFGRSLDLEEKEYVRDSVLATIAR